MSWADYVNNNMVGTKHLTQGAIVGYDGTTWAASSGFSVSQAEVRELLVSLKELSHARTSGIVVNNNKYIALTLTDRALYGKKGQDGVVVVKTAKALLIGVYGQGQTHGRAVNVVEKLADYLQSSGY